MEPEINSKKTSIQITIGLTLLALALISMYIYKKYQYNKSAPPSSSNQSAPKGLLSPMKITSLEETKRYVEDIDTLLANDNSLTTNQRNRLLLRKAYIVLASRSSADIQSGLKESSSILRSVYDITGENSAGTSTASAESKVAELLHEEALFGFVYNFASNCFARAVTGYLPDKFTSVHYKNRDTMTLRQRQQAAFRTMIDIAYGQNFDHFSNDKSLVSNRMFIVAAYLSSYKSEMPKTEVDTLLKRLDKDLLSYKKTEALIFSNPIRTQYASGLHYAFAYDIRASFREQPLTSKDNIEIDGNYNTVRSYLLVASSSDRISLSMVGMMNDTYQLASMQKRFKNKGITEEKYNAVFNSLKNNVFSSPEVTDITKGFYNYTLTDPGQWFTVKHDLFSLAKDRADLMALMKSAGVNVDKIK